MAIIHQATITPSKAEILGSWLPRQPWYAGAGEFRRVASYRFDDPAGEVGLEATIVDTGAGVLHHVPCSYRSAPLRGAEDFLIATAEHSVLGTRYFYDAAGDPVWAAALITAIRCGGVQADEVRPDGTVREPSMRVSGTGSGPSDVVGVAAVRTADEAGITVVTADDVDVLMVRTVGTEIVADAVLTGNWGSQDVVLAGLR